MTNLQYSKTPAFMSACATADVDATSRQASKYRNQRGRAWNQRGKARKVKPQVQPLVEPLVEPRDLFRGVVFTGSKSSVSEMTVPELRAACRVRGVKGYSKLRKAELLSLLAR